MSGLVLKLNPQERVLINGAVIENGDRRSRVSILTPNTNILRLRDAIRPDDANTPVKRVCYIAQLVLSGDVSIPDATHQIMQGIESLSQVLRDDDSRAHLTTATNAAHHQDFYRVLKSLRALLPREARLMQAYPI
ncbi:flagellar biosynthesis repressor FlbT [Yoonia sp. 208BN28-4]|uniref:flagellar biosynthesis repressor FlbT n=1 Tax=Yoonia sp. 208BN28-4 TaxID=3126505 RepID=UPI0030A1F816